MMWNVLRKRRSERPKMRDRVRLSIEFLEDSSLLSTFTVVNLNDAGTGTGLTGDLRYCIVTANANDDLSNRIVFQPGLTGTVRLTKGELTITKSLEIAGPGAGQLTISGNHRSGVFDITAPDSETILLADLTITGGIGIKGPNFSTGGGLQIDAAAVTLNRVVVTGNSVGAQGSGAGIESDGTLVLNDSTVSDNTGQGALDSLRPVTINYSTFEDNTNFAILNDGGMTITGSTIADNYNGAIQSNSPLTMTACQVTGNTGNYGAGFLNHDAATIVDTLIEGNSSIAGGGGIGNIGGEMTVTGCTIADNTVQGYGGGINNTGDLVLENTTITGNHADWTGGGIFFGDNANPSFLQITSCTITDNTVGQGPFDQIGGGGLRAGGARAALVRNSIIAGNSSQTLGPDVRGTVTSLGYNLIGDSTDSVGWNSLDLTGTSGSPLNPELGPLQDNGGPTPTQALLAGSPALRAGDPMLRYSSDQRGSGRISVFTQAEVDIGAFNAGDAAQFLLVAPAAARPGQPIAMTLTALDRWGNRATTYTGTVHFSSTDFNAQLPNDSVLTAADAGSGTFTVTLNTLGARRIRASDLNQPSMHGDADVMVQNNFSAPSDLIFLTRTWTPRRRG
jgi:hypothetical protein